MESPLVATEELAKRLFEAWRPAGGKYWRELGPVEQRHWESVARTVEREQTERNKRLQEALDLVRDLASANFAHPCSFDHHGYCQEHGWLETDPSCPIPRARALLDADG